MSRRSHHIVRGMAHNSSSSSGSGGGDGYARYKYRAGTPRLGRSITSPRSSDRRVRFRPVPTTLSPPHPALSPPDLLTTKVGARLISRVVGRVAAAGISTLVADDIRHLRRAAGPAEERLLPRQAKVRLLAAPVAQVHLSLPLVGAAELRLLPLSHERQ